MLDVFNIVSYMISFLVSYINISFLLEKKPKIWYILFGIILFIPTILVQTPFRLLFQIIIFSFIFYLSTKNLSKTITAILFYFFSLMVVECSCSVILLLNKIEFTKPILYITNIIISLLSYILIRTKLFMQLWSIFKNKIQKYNIILIILFLIFCYITIGYRYAIINISILFIIISILIYLLIKEISHSYLIKIETEKMVGYIKTYENQIDEFRVKQHEFKNTLICIKGMVSNNKDAVKFIDSILNDENKEDYDILKDVMKVEISPIKGLIYHKLLMCKQNDIHSVLNVDSGISFKKIKKVDSNTLRDITIVLGVLLDNAIEASLKTMERSLSIYLYNEDDKFIFQISNTFNESFNVDLLWKQGYGTKGKERGYGLALAKKTIDKNKNLDIKSEIRNDVFIQYLEVDFSK